MATAPRSSDSRGIFVNIRVSGSNESYLGYLHIYNASFVMPPVIQPRFNSKSSNQDHPNDPKGAGYYVVVIVLIYGMSIIALIASHIKRKHSKLVEDRQIHKYLKEFQSIRDKSRKDAYRNSERAVLAHLQTHAPAFMPKSTYGNLGQALFPALAMITPASFNNDRPADNDDDNNSTDDKGEHDNEEGEREEDGDGEEQGEDALDTASRIYTVNTDSSDDHDHAYSTPTSELGSPIDLGAEASTMQAASWQRDPSPGLGVLPPPHVVIDVSYLDEDDSNARYQRAADVMLANAVLCNDTNVRGGGGGLFGSDGRGGLGLVGEGEGRSFHNHGALLSPMSDVDGYCLTPVSDMSLSESFSSTVPLLPSVSFSSRHHLHHQQQQPSHRLSPFSRSEATASSSNSGAKVEGHDLAHYRSNGDRLLPHHNGTTGRASDDETVTVQVTNL